MAVFIAAYGFEIFVFLCVMAVFAVRKKGIVQKDSMTWYDSMTDEEKKKFLGVIAVTVIGTVMILLVPVVFALIT